MLHRACMPNIPTDSSKQPYGNCMLTDHAPPRRCLEASRVKETLIDSSRRWRLRILAHCCVANPRNSTAIAVVCALHCIQNRKTSLAARIDQRFLEHFCVRSSAHGRPAAHLPAKYPKQFISLHSCLFFCLASSCVHTLSDMCRTGCGGGCCLFVSVVFCCVGCGMRGPVGPVL